MMVKLKESPSQTAGPYVHIGCLPRTAGLEQRGMGAQLGSVPVLDHAVGKKIILSITVLDGDGALVNDALVEIWQAGTDGNCEVDVDFSHWDRQATDFSSGRARFKTLKPAATDGQAPHILVWIVARGINLGLTTRIYFPDEDNSADPLMKLAKERASSLVATKTDDGYTHVIHLQGPNETVFLNV